MRRFWAMTAVAATLALVAGACARSAGSQIGLARLFPLEGAVLAGSGTDLDPVGEVLDLLPGDEVRTGPDGRALLRLAGGQSIELAPDAEIRLDPGMPQLMNGSALVRAPSSITLAAGSSDPVQVEGRGGVFRVDRGISLRVAVYSGSASLAGTGLEKPIVGLREAVVAAGIAPLNPRPLQVDPADPWDVRLLGEAMEVGLDLDRLQQGLSRQMSEGGRDIVARVLPGAFRPGAALSVLQGVRPAESVVAAVVALRGARSGGIEPLEALEGVVELRQAGAHWIVVVAEWQLAQMGILDALNRVSNVVVRLAIANPPTASGDQQSPSGGLSPTGGGTGSAPPTGGPPGDDPPRDPPPKDPPPKDPSCEGLDCTVEQILGSEGLGLTG